jgi:hypothetical protein
MQDRSSDRIGEETRAISEGAWSAATAFMRCRRELLENTDPAREPDLLARILRAIDNLERRLLEDDAEREFFARERRVGRSDEPVASIRAAAARAQRCAEAEREFVRSRAAASGGKSPASCADASTR